MDGTLDSIRASECEATTANMSYLYGRDPSILAFGQRPILSSKRNLISLYEDEETEYQDETHSTASDASNASLLQTVKVYLRMKPFPRKLKLTKDESEAYRITNGTTLVTKLPALDNTFSSLKGQKHAESVCRKFTFTRTFGPETTQLQLFEEVIQQRMLDFLTGQNCTVMTYGTTNSGKSYTLQGTTTSPGIIPRGLEFVFSNINPRPTPCYKPVHSSSVVCLNAVERAQEIDAKNKLLTFASIDKHQYINAYKQMQKLLQEESPIRPSSACDAHYSVWVSFAEIYNENIYDLLSNDCQKRRPLLKLAADNHDRAFIKGLKTICVNSGSEAYQVLMAGQYNLKVAATALNARSSRSHCIFTIQLLKYYVENIPESVEISTFTFCDLAGSERLKKTLNVGDRLREAQNINTSLLVLGRCLKSIYEGQSLKQRQEHVGPFRESKLTRLFQRALSGKEQIALIVNVNPIPNLYVETQNALNFSAIAKKIIIEPKKIHRRVSNSRFSQIVAQSVKSNTDWDPSDLCHIVETSNVADNQSDFINPDDYDDLLEENKSLKNELSNLKATMLNKDLQIRQELTDTYTAMMKKLEADWKNRIEDVEAQNEDHLEWRVNLVEAFYKDKLNELASRKRRRTDENGSDDEIKDINELEIENSRLQAKVHTLKKTLKSQREKNETLLIEKSKLDFEISTANDQIKSLKGLLAAAQNSICKDEESIIYVDELRKQLSDKQEHVKKLKEFLNEAKEEYISISSHAEMMEDRLKEREEELAETMESVADLKLLLENTNACLEEKTKATDILEEKLSQQTNSMLKAEENHRKIQSNLEKTIKELKEKLNSLEKSSSNENILNSMLPDIEIKKEISSESEAETSTEFPGTIIPEGIIIKTDKDEIRGIPSTNYEDERESEMFLQVREITMNEHNDEPSDEKLAEIRAKLSVTASENESLKNKLTQNLSEIQSLKESLRSTKTELNAITEELTMVKDFQAEVKARDDSLARKTLEQHVLLKDCESQTNAISMNEGSNQTDDIIDHNKSIQTSFVGPNEHDKSVQTIECENEDLTKTNQIHILEQKCTKIEADYKENESLISELKHEIEKLRKNNDSLEQRSSEDHATMGRLNDNIKSLEKDLAAAISDKESLEKKLNEAEEMQKKLEFQLSECRNVHELSISNLKKELFMTKERENGQLESIKEHAEKVSDLEKTFVATVKEQKEKIEELSKCVERLGMEKKQLEEKLKDNSKKMEEMEKRIQLADKRDREKDEEIKALQKSCKRNLSAEIQDEKLHEEMKANLKELLETKEALARTDELYQRLKASSKKEIDHLEAHISSLEKNSKMLEILQQKTQTDKAEIEQLKIDKGELKALLVEKELEMKSFMGNRDKMILQYETLVKSLQEESERGKKENTMLQELLDRTSKTPRGKANKTEEEDQRNQIQLVDLSDSETKRTRRRAALPPPPTEAKRSTRKKKLYVPADESCVDLEVCEAVPPTPSPSTSTRSLRNRKK